MLETLDRINGNVRRTSRDLLAAVTAAPWEPIHVISLGAGVQSSTMAIMADRGLLTPRPAFCIFADTQNEPKAVYEWLAYLKTVLTIPIHVVSAGNLAHENTRPRISSVTGRTYYKNFIPAFLLTQENGGWRKGLLRRKCTSDFKLEPLKKWVRALARVPRGCTKIWVKQWIGISTDEADRMKPSRVPWSENIYPLIDAGMSRQDCLDWMKAAQLPTPPKSACVFCPYHNDAMWLHLKQTEPAAFDEAVQFERRLQELAPQQGIKGIPFLHADRKPLDQVVFDANVKSNHVSHFSNECEGICGV
jgi:hypothetical protein